MKTENETTNELRSGWREFLTIWSGQLLSLVGSAITGFALGIWVYQKSGSVTQFSLVTLCNALPVIVASPFAGAIVDRWNRRWAMILSDLASGICTVMIALLLSVGNLEFWHVLVLTSISAFFRAFQWPAYLASMSSLLPKEQLARGNGLLQAAEAIAALAAPVLGGVLLGLISLRGIIILDLATFSIALVTLLCVRIPEIRRSGSPGDSKNSLLSEIKEGWTYIASRRGLLSLLIYFAVGNFFVAMVHVLVTPLVLSFASERVLGAILSTGGLGMLLGTITLTVWGGPKRLVLGVLVFDFICGLSIFVAGFNSNPYFLGAIAFVFFFSVPINEGCCRTIFQRKVDVAVQGRVFSLVRMMAGAAMPLAYLSAGPLADGIFEPFMANHGTFAVNIGRIIGTGPGRGIGLMFIIMGACHLTVTMIAYSYPRLRQVESDVPDAVPDAIPNAIPDSIRDADTIPQHSRPIAQPANC